MNYDYVIKTNFGLKCSETPINKKVTFCIKK